MTPTPRSIAVLLGLAALAPAGCARPGQLGHPAPAAQAVAAPAAVPPPALPAPPAVPAAAELGSGTVDGRVSIRTPGPAVYAVRTVVLAPGESQGWRTHPGTELALVRRGAVALVREGACAPARFGVGQALVVADGVPHRLTNDGTEPAELLVTELLTPGVPETSDVAPACREA